MALIILTQNYNFQSIRFTLKRYNFKVWEEPIKLLVEMFKSKALFFNLLVLA